MAQIALLIIDKSKYLWITDPHIKPWNRHKLLKLILDNNPVGIFLTGDITYGPNLVSDLNYLGERVGCNIYFVLGNHDYHGSSLEKTHNGIRELCIKHKNLIWMTEADIISINDKTALIGTEGWYDARNGDPKYIRYSLDWIFVSDFKSLPSMKERIEVFRKMADESADVLSKRLKIALNQHDTVYLLTHFPPWKEANRDVGTFMERLWKPYNVNLVLGGALETVMDNYSDKNLIVLAGHTHTDCWINVSSNIECRVNQAKYFGSIRNEEQIYI